MHERAAEVRVATPAKINLTLAVGRAREDGYHPLATVYQAVGLYDDVVLRSADEPKVTVSGDGVAVDEVPLDGSNLVLRAVALLARHHDRELVAAVHVHKRIPVAGGLAGGSSDAAAALVGADRLFELRTPRAEMLGLAAELGSDVPFCVVGGTALGAGRGELVTPVMTRGQFWWLVVPDDRGLSTPAVYGRFDMLTHRRRIAEPEVPDALLAALRSADPARLGAALANDLEEAALSLRPDLAERLAAGRQGGALAGQVSGSGPTTVFLCEGPDQAEALDALLQDECETRPGLVAPGPVHGARVTSGHS